VITETGIQTHLFVEKELNLFLYIPPHSAHSPDVLGYGLVIGMMLRILHLTMAMQDKKTALLLSFFLRLCNHSYSSEVLWKLFAEALTNTELPTFNKNWWIHKKRCFLHLPYHPNVSRPMALPPTPTEPSCRASSRTFAIFLIARLVPTG
jgi:hypothetical protein